MGQAKKNKLVCFNFSEWLDWVPDQIVMAPLLCFGSEVPAVEYSLTQFYSAFSQVFLCLVRMNITQWHIIFKEAFKTMNVRLTFF